MHANLQLLFEFLPSANYFVFWQLLSYILYVLKSPFVNFDKKKQTEYKKNW